jgi:hypothetical protein
MHEHERPDRLADELDEQTDQLEHDSERLAQRIHETREEWDAKRRDPKVPGAITPEGDDDEEQGSQ